MNKWTSRNAWLVGMVMLTLFGLHYEAIAGIPEPALVLYGKVTDTDGALVTDGVLEWTYESADRKTKVTVIAALEEVSLEGEAFSYSVQLPLETIFPGAEATPNTIPLSTTPVEYSRTPVLNGKTATIQVSRNTIISMDDRGRFERIDLRTLGEGTFTWGDLASATTAPVVIDCDGVTGGLDASLVLQWYAGLITELRSCPDGSVFIAPDFPPGANVNGDSVLGGQDASEILKLYAGLIPCLSADPDCVSKDGGRAILAENVPTKLRNLSMKSQLLSSEEDTSFTMPVVIDDGTDIESFRLQITYSPKEIQIVSVKNSALGEGWSQPVVNRGRGSITVVNAGLDALKGSGAFIEFEAKLSPGVLGGTMRFGSGTEVNDGGTALLTSSARIALDTDGDGISDEEEGRCPKKDPACTDTDSDGDGIPDYLENNFLDSDGDGIPDYLEDNFLDSDGDGIPDYLDAHDSRLKAVSIPNAPAMTLPGTLLLIVLLLGAASVVFRRRRA